MKEGGETKSEAEQEKGKGVEDKKGVGRGGNDWGMGIREVMGSRYVEERGKGDGVGVRGAPYT